MTDWVSVGISAVGALSSIAGGLGGKSAAEEAGEKQADIIRKTEAENQRRRELDLAQKLGGITGAVAASNLRMSGSTQRYKSGFESQYRSEMAWDKQKSRIEARMAEKAGDMAGQSAMYSGLGSAVGFAGQAYAAAKPPKVTPSPSGP